MQQQYPILIYELALDMFALARCWEPGIVGPRRGRAFEELFYAYCAQRQLILSETAGARTLNGVRSASGFLHENDGVLSTPDLSLHVELKHLTQAVTKLDIVSFNQKGLDFLNSEDMGIRKRPLYRMLVSGSELRPQARVFAVQWGILVIEPGRLPLVSLHQFAKSLPHMKSLFSGEASEIAQEVPQFIVPVQERLRRIVSNLDSDEALISTYRVERMLQLQEEVGDEYWRLMDKLEPDWIEDRYDSIFESSMSGVGGVPIY
jgi:hypothetical protein